MITSFQNRRQYQYDARPACLFPSIVFIVPPPTFSPKKIDVGKGGKSREIVGRGGKNPLPRPCDARGRACTACAPIPAAFATNPPIRPHSISRTGSKPRPAPKAFGVGSVRSCSKYFPLPFLSSWLPYKLSFSCIRVLSVFHPWLAVLSVHFLFSSFPSFLIDTRPSS